MLPRRTIQLGLATLASVVLSPSAGAQEVWSGSDVFFEKENFADPTDPANQDRMTPNVWITRASSQGIYNAAQEGSYQQHTSPADTEWATGNAADWESLTFTSWFEWHGGPTTGPLDVVGVDAVVHLITNDIYVDIRIESWTSGGTGGGFSYVRGSKPLPVERKSWGGIKSVYLEPPR